MLYTVIISNALPSEEPLVVMILPLQLWVSRPLLNLILNSTAVPLGVISRLHQTPLGELRLYQIPSAPYRFLFGEQWEMVATQGPDVVTLPSGHVLKKVQ